MPKIYLRSVYEDQGYTISFGTDEDVKDFNKMLTKFKAQGVVDTKVTVGDLEVLLDDRGPLDLT